MSVLTWSSEQRTRASQAIAAEIERARATHKFINTQKVPDTSRTVPANTFNPQNGRVDDGVQLPVIELFVEFVLTKLQAEDPNLDSALTIIRRAAVDLARGDDSLILTGQVNGGRCQHRGNLNAVTGLLEAAERAGIEMVGETEGRYADDMISQVAAGRTHLDEAGFSGGYVMVMGTRFFAEANRPTPGSPERPIKVIEGIIEGPVHSSSVIPADTALLIAATADAIDRASANEPSLDYSSVRIGDAEERICRVYERFTPRVKDPRCVVMFRLRARGVAEDVRFGDALRQPVREVDRGDA